MEQLNNLQEDYLKFQKHEKISIIITLITFFLTAILPPIAIIFVSGVIAILIFHSKKKKTYTNLFRTLKYEILKSIGIQDLKFKTNVDTYITVKSPQAVNNYNDVKYFKDFEGKLSLVTDIMKEKSEYAKTVREFFKNNKYKDFICYDVLKKDFENTLLNTNSYNIKVSYSSPTGRSTNYKILTINQKRIKELNEDKSLLMTKSEYSKYLKEQKQKELENKQHKYYEKVNSLIDLVNNSKENIIVEDDLEELDKLVVSLFDRTVNSIKKVKTTESEEWDILSKYIKNIKQDIEKILDKNNKIIKYYKSSDFKKIKNTCDELMKTQRDFNEYIDEKVKSITSLFGTRIIRNETDIEDEYNYIHPYKKTITPFTVEVSSNVFASAENSPLDYIVKYFYPDKKRYPEQIQKLHLLIEELETLREAKVIIENHKKDVEKYLSEVPKFIMQNDEDGFYSRLGFAKINEKSLVVEYKFSYTSNGGKAQRSFTVPMTEEVIIELIRILESKLTISSFSKEQRALMTSKLRTQIKERDNYTCKYCGNSVHKEPNLLLEIDQIIPISKGGYTEEANLQTLCWKCNRGKGAKII